MQKCTACVALLIAVSVCCGSAGAQVFPSVSFDFDAVTFTYTYTVSIPGNSTYPFGYFQVDTHLAWAANWSTSGPWVPNAGTGVDQNWSSGYATWQVSPQHDFAFWRASTGQQIPAGTAWLGDFVLIVPDSLPTDGWVLTKDGVGASENHLQRLVPGPVPEPSAFAALGAGLAGLAGFGIRRRRR